MSTVQIACPKCQKNLKLPDRSMLGKMGRCPKCGHRFRLDESNDEVQLELVEPQQPAVGTDAKWIPDSPATAAPPLQPAEPTFPNFNPTSNEPQFPGVTPPQEPIFPGPPTGDASPSAFPDFGASAPQSAAAPNSAASVSAAPISAVAAATGGLAPDDPLQRIKEQQLRNARKRNRALAIGGVTALIVGGLLFAFRSSWMPAPVVVEAKPQPTMTEGYAAKQEQLSSNEALAVASSPTDGDPIQLLMMPAGVRILIHLRPAELWEAGSRGEEVRYCLGQQLAEWSESKLKELSHREPAQIEEATFGLILGPRGTPPQMAAVFRMVEEAKPSELIVEFRGERIDEYGAPVYVVGDLAYYIHDTKTIAVAPVALVGEMIDAVKYPSPTSPGVEEILMDTDRKRQLTLVFEPADARRHHEFLVAENVRPAFGQLMGLFGDDVETVAWSFYFGSEFYSEMLLRNKQGTSPRRVEDYLTRRLGELPQQLVTAVRFMHPTQAGPRQLIGRYPAMIQAFQLATKAGAADRHVRLTTQLPERAAPNLALASLLAWDESTRTDFTTEPAPSSNGSSNLPATLAERLELPIDMDFRRTPLQEAFAYIADEAKVPIEIDGDAIKLSGYTKNMPQTFAMSKTPAIVGLWEILKRYDQMCLVLDEQAKKAIVLTKPIAAKRGLTPYPVEEKAKAKGAQ